MKILILKRDIQDREVVPGVFLSSSIDKISMFNVIVDLDGLVNKVVNGKLYVLSYPENLGLKVEYQLSKLFVNGKVLRYWYAYKLIVPENQSECILTIDSKCVAVKIQTSIITSLRPILSMLLLEPKLVVDELVNFINSTHLKDYLSHKFNIEFNPEVIAKNIIELIKSERKSKRYSKTLAILEQLLEVSDYELSKKLSELPTHILDVLVEYGLLVDGKVRKDLLRKVLEWVEKLAYPR